MHYTPNSPRGRLAWVLRQYGERGPRAVVGTFSLAAEMMGLEVAARSFGHRVYRLADPLTIPAQTEAWLRGEFPQAGVPPTHFVHDRLFPWIARELYRAGSRDPEGTERAYARLSGRCTAIAQWAAAERIDIMAVSFEEALEAADEFAERARRRPARAGEVVFAWPDGWTMQRLTTPEQLDDEGALVQHCVGDGGYDARVRSGDTIIYSLRSPAGSPHVTVEYSAEIGMVNQVFGKQNRAPAPAYAARIAAWLRAKFDPPRAAHGLYLAGEDVGAIDWRGAQVQYAEFHAPLTGIAFDAADLGVALFGNDLRNCSFVGSNLWGATFDHDHDRLVVNSCRFDGARMTRADWKQASVHGCSFRFVELVSTLVVGVSFERCIFEGASFAPRTHGFWRRPFDRVEFHGCALTSVQRDQLASIARDQASDITIDGEPVAPGGP